MISSVRGTIHGLGLAKKYPDDDTEPMEILIPKNLANGLPYRNGFPVPIDLLINGEHYDAVLRSTEANSQVYISQRVRTKDGISQRLSYVLTNAGFNKNDKIILEVDGSNIVLKGTGKSGVTKKRVFGHLPGIAVGSCYASYAELYSAGVHIQTQAGISGSSTEGADSIVVSGGYEDDKDFGDEIIYTGQGGRDKNGQHIKDQQLERGNLALLINEIEGLPVRVIRGADRKNKFSPSSGYRYDGLYRVESHWHEKGKAGFVVWRYRLMKIDTDYMPPVKLDTSPSRPLDGGNTNPIRKTLSVQRIVRDTKQAKKLKLHYEHTCQVCGMQITTAAGLYAEAAHIRPLGEPHNGPDTPDNIICLCPNHHVMFDLGTFSIADNLTLVGIKGRLVVRDGHKIDACHLRYHRDHYLNRVPMMSDDE